MAFVIILIAAAAVGLIVTVVVAFCYRVVWFLRGRRSEFSDKLLLIFPVVTALQFSYWVYDVYIDIDRRTYRSPTGAYEADISLRPDFSGLYDIYEMTVILRSAETGKVIGRIDAGVREIFVTLFGSEVQLNSRCFRVFWNETDQGEDIVEVMLPEGGQSFFLPSGKRVSPIPETPPTRPTT